MKINLTAKKPIGQNGEYEEVIVTYSIESDRYARISCYIDGEFVRGISTDLREYTDNSNCIALFWNFQTYWLVIPLLAECIVKLTTETENITKVIDMKVMVVEVEKKYIN